MHLQALCSVVDFEQKRYICGSVYFASVSQLGDAPRASASASVIQYSSSSRAQEPFEDAMYSGLGSCAELNMVERSKRSTMPTARAGGIPTVQRKGYVHRERHELLLLATCRCRCWVWQGLGVGKATKTMVSGILSAVQQQQRQQGLRSNAT